MQFRRSDYDVTNTVQVSSVASVRQCSRRSVQTDMARHRHAIALAQAFTDFERLFTGQFPGYCGCDTVYHDMQHSLDDTLAMARLLAGYDRAHTPDQRLGGDRALMGIVVDDVPRLRLHPADRRHAASQRRRVHAARTSVAARSSSSRYLPSIGLANWVPVATQIIHFTGYEVPFDQIRLDEHARSQSRPPARHGRHARADVGSLLPREMPRPAVPRVRARRSGDAALGQRRAQGACTVRASTCCARRRSFSPKRCARGSTASSTARIDISRRSTAGATRTWKRSSATSISQPGLEEWPLVDAASLPPVLHVGTQPAAADARAGDRPDTDSRHTGRLKRTAAIGPRGRRLHVRRSGAAQ